MFHTALIGGALAPDGPLRWVIGVIAGLIIDIKGGQPVACHLLAHHARQLCALLTIGPFWCTQTGTAAFFGMTAGSFPVQL
ncbi:MAG TPA: hypothetical protein PLD79_02660 [Halothiobacillus sp.]|nr:hypothetical protein [Halothiobacillus sp.]